MQNNQTNNSISVRYKDAPWNPLVNDVSITIGGVGGIGSYLTFLLVRMGFSLNLYDMDKVENENLGVQMFTRAQLHQAKTYAAVEGAKRYMENAGGASHNYFERFEKGSLISSVCFSCFDNMQARKDMFETWLDLVEETKTKEPEKLSGLLFIDGRTIMARLLTVV